MNSAVSTIPVEYPTFVINDVTYSLRMTLAAACELEKEEINLSEPFKAGGRNFQTWNKLFSAMVGTVDEKGRWSRFDGADSLAEQIPIQDFAVLTQVVASALKPRPAGTTTETPPAEATGPVN